MGMSLAHGGHLTHGAAPTFSGKWLHSVHYGVREADQRIDYDAVAELASEYHPKLIIAGGSAYPRQTDFARFREIADSVDAKQLGRSSSRERGGQDLKLSGDALSLKKK